MPRYRPTTLPPPYLKRLWLDAQGVDRTAYPWCLPLFRHEFELDFDSPITIIAGENGVGKSTLLEGIAVLAGFDEAGGGPGYRAVDSSNAVEQGGGVLASRLRASWLPKIGQGWFFRAESFFSVARYLDEAGSPSADFLSHSHGEGFLRFFEERCARPGLYLFDEPESALSPARQFDFLGLLQRIQAQEKAQAIIATHSPILMALPGVRLLAMGKYGIQPIELEDTEHFRIYRQFVTDPHGLVREMLDPL
jgi:predicted ATPase